MTLLRLSPIIPFNAINYIAGVTAISLMNYCLALFAILPGTILYVFLGASAGSLADSANSNDNMTVTIVVIVVGIVFGIGAVALTSFYAKKELTRVSALTVIEHEHPMLMSTYAHSLFLNASCCSGRGGTRGCGNRRGLPRGRY